MFMYTFIKGILYLPTKIFMPTKIIGNPVPKTGKFILTCNHQSLNDAVTIAVYTKRKINFMAKKELAENCFLRFFVKHSGIITIDRDNPDLTSMKKVFSTLKDGKLLGIFPEGTRNKVEGSDLLPFKNGTVLFAIKTKTPIIPMLLVRKPKYFRRNQMIIGEPFELSEFYGQALDKDILDKASAILREKTLSLREKSTLKSIK